MSDRGEKRPDAMDALAGSGPERREVATEMMLAALRAAAEGTSYRMLRALIAAESLSVEDLMKEAGLTRLSTLERVSGLGQAGLASRDLQSGRVQPTLLARGLVGFLERVRGRFEEKIAERLPKLGEGRR